MRKNIFILLLVRIWLGSSLEAQNLDAYLKLGAENNPSLQAQYKAFEAALQKIPQASSLADPTFSLGAFISPLETRVGPQRVRLSLNQMLPWFGTLKAKEAVAARQAEAQYQAFLDAKALLDAQIAAAYYPFYERGALAKLERENIRVLQSYKRLATARVEHGNGSLTDALRVDLILAASHTQLEILQAQLSTLQIQFNRLLHRDDSATVQVSDTLALPSALAANVLDTLWQNHPKMQQLIRIEAAYEAQEKAAIKQGMPQIGVGLEYMVIDRRDDMNVADNGKDVWMPKVSVTLPIYRQKYGAAQQEAVLLRESSKVSQEALTDQFRVAFEKLRFEQTQQLALVSQYQRQIETTDQIIRLLLKAYSTSGVNLEEILRMQEEKIKLQKLKIRAIVKWHILFENMKYYFIQ